MAVSVLEPWLFTLPVSCTGAVIADASGDADAAAEGGGLDTVSVLLLLHAAAASNAMPATAQNLRTTHLPLDETHPGDRTTPPLVRFPNGGLRTRITTLRTCPSRCGKWTRHRS